GAPASEAMRSPEPSCVADVGQPRLDEVGAEGEDDLGLLEGVVWNGVAAEDLTVRRANRLIAEGFEGHSRPGARALHPPIEQRGLASALELRHDRHRPSLARTA